MENKEIDVTVSLFFEIADSGMFGGPGSIGYSASKIDLIAYELENFKLQEYAKAQIKSLAELMEVPEENIRIISGTEYDENTEVD